MPAGACGGRSGGGARGGMGFSVSTAPVLLKSLSRIPVFFTLDRISCRFRKKRQMMMIKKRVQKTKDADFFGGGEALVFRFLGAATIQ
jgi:hypothetical protein